MALFRKLFYRKPPDGLLEISERVYVFDCCFTTDTWQAEDYKVYTGGIVGQLREHFPDASILVFNFRDEQARSRMGNILSEYDMTIMDYPRHYEGCPVLKMEVIHHFLRSCESWLSLGQQNVLLMHCEQGGWPVLAFMLAALLIYRKQFTGEQRTLDMVYKQAPRELLVLLCPLNPIPSQLRYLQYVSRRNVASEWPPADRALNLDCVIIRLIPNFDGEGGCRPMFRIYGQDPHVDGDKASKILYSTPKKGKALRMYKQAECELVKLDISCHVQGDVLLECISIDGKLEHEIIMFRVMFNTAFIRSNILMLNRDEIDIQWDAKDRFPKDFRAEILFSEIDAAASVMAMDFPCFEEKEGLPVEAFAKVKEIFSHVDWLDPKTDVSLDVLQHIGVSNIVHEKLDPRSPRGLQISSSQETSPTKILEKCRIVESSAKVSLSSIKEDKSVPSTKLSSDSAVCENSELQRSQINQVRTTNQSMVDSPQHAGTYALPTKIFFQSVSGDGRLPSNTKALSPSHFLSEHTFETHSVTVLPDMSEPASLISPSIPPVSKGRAVEPSPSPALPPAPDITLEATVPHVTATVKDDLGAKPRCSSPSAASAVVAHLPPPSPELDQSEDLGAKPSLEQDIALSSGPPPSTPLKENLGVRPKPPPLPPSVTSATASPMPPPPPPPPLLKDDSGVTPIPPSYQLYTSSTKSTTPPTEGDLSVKPQAHTTPAPLRGSEIASSMTTHPTLPLMLPKRDSLSVGAPRAPPPSPAPALSSPVPVAPPPPPRPPSFAGSAVSSSITSYSPPPAIPSVRDYSSVKVQAHQPPPPPPVASPVTPTPPPPPPTPPELPARETLSSKPGPPPPPPPPLHSGQAPGPTNSTPVPPPPPPMNPSNVPSAPPPPFSSRGSVNSTGSLRNSGPNNSSSNGAKGRLSRTISARSNQMKKLKPLHWLKLTRAVQGSLWADAQKFGEASNAPEIDMSELETLFSAAVPNSDNSKSGLRGSRGPKSEKVQLVDHRRAYNCEIMLSKVKVPLQDLMSSVLALEDTALDVDQVDNLIKFCPTKEEIELLKGYNGDKDKLGKCEQFFYELMKVPRVEIKLRVLSFKMQFRSQVSDLRNSLNIVKSVAEEIRSSVKLKKIMQTILSLGNALNQGTARGSAVGFRLDSLLKLTDTRARNNKMTLMHYLCKVLGEKMPELLDFPKDLPNLEPASKIQLKFLAEEMQAINKGLERVIQELSCAENDGPVSETFCKNLKEFLRFAEAEVRSLASLYSGVGRNVDALIVYFGEDPARCPFEQVISTLLNFTRNFKRAHEENCKQLELEMKKTAEAEKLKSKETEKLTTLSLVKSNKPNP